MAVSSHEKRWKFCGSWGAKGFTLIELLVVLVIIALASGLVGARLIGSMTSVDLRTASKTVAASLRYARSVATSTRTPQVARIDFETNSVTISAKEEKGDATRADKKGAGSVPAGAASEKAYTLPEGIRWEKAIRGDTETESGVFEILFFPNGNSTGGELLLVSDRERRYRIEVDFVLGSVTLREEEEL